MNNSPDSQRYALDKYIERMDKEDNMIWIRWGSYWTIIAPLIIAIFNVNNIFYIFALLIIGTFFSYGFSKIVSNARENYRMWLEDALIIQKSLGLRLIPDELENSLITHNIFCIVYDFTTFILGIILIYIFTLPFVLWLMVSGMLA